MAATGPQLPFRRAALSTVKKRLGGDITHVVARSSQREKRGHGEGPCEGSRAPGSGQG